VAIEARLAEHICQCTAEGLRDAGDFDPDGLDVLAAIRTDERPSRRSKKARVGERAMKMTTEAMTSGRK
jgi:hypothetical protein